MQTLCFVPLAEIGAELLKYLCMQIQAKDAKNRKAEKRDTKRNEMKGKLATKVR